MRILITNDDGILAPGLSTLEAIAQEIAGPKGEVWTVAPTSEQSGVGHCISYTLPCLCTKLAERQFSVDGKPADCVLVGIHEIMKDAAPDLILSGVNKGNNSAENTLYSGTIGAAIEGALQGIPSIALSQYFGPENKDLQDQFEAARAHGTHVVRYIWEHGAWDNAAYRLFYNVNFPPVAAADVKGMKAAAQGRRDNIQFRAIQETSPSGRNFIWMRGGAQNIPSAPGTDAAVNLDGYISITPMRADLTCTDTLAAFEGTLP